MKKKGLICIYFITQSLKATTKDILYERFRTEKLLARRATANISEEERKRMIEGQSLTLPFSRDLDNFVNG